MAGVEYLPFGTGMTSAAPQTAAVVEMPALPAGEVTPPTNDLELRRVELKLLAQRVSQCMRCPELASTRTQTVFGVGPIDPELCFIGVAPGADEDRQGEPFVGAAGQLLNRIISALGMKREEIYICNILRCRPPGNRQPQAAEANHCREWLEATLKLVGPRYIVCWGAVAAKNLLSTEMAIGKMRKKFHDYQGIPVLCTYHPSYVLRLEGQAHQNAKREVWDDMKLLLTKMGRPAPAGPKA